MHSNDLKTSLRWLASSVLGIALTACDTAPTRVDMNFGGAVKAAQVQQTLQPTPSHCMHGMHTGRCTIQQHQGEHMHKPAHMREHHSGAAIDTDGVSAKAAIELYQESFRIPSPTAPVFTIGVGSGSAR